MGLSSKSNSNIKYLKVVYENKDKDNGKPAFGVMEKVNDAWVVGQTDTTLSGRLIGIEKSSYEYKSKPQYQFKLKIQDDTDTFSLDLGYSFFSRNILNSISTIGKLETVDLEINIWRNKEGFVTVGVKANGEKTEWKLKQSDLPKSDEPKWLASFDYFIDLITPNLSTDRQPAPSGNFAEADESAGDSGMDAMQMEEQFAKEAAAKKDTRSNAEKLMDDKGTDADDESDLPF